MRTIQRRIVPVDRRTPRRLHRLFLDPEPPRRPSERLGRSVDKDRRSPSTQAWALNMLGGGGGTTVTIGIYRWSSDAERSALINVLKTEGNAQLVADMSQLPQVGYI